MKSRNAVKFFSVLIACLLLLPEISNAATEYATFESFYRQSSNTLWILAGAGVAAIIGGAFIFFTGGAASPAVASIGTWLGGLMGYSGIAATNAGLALLGGGSLASGGFGIIGGTALLAATFTFSTSVVLDYATGNAIEAYDYSKFVDNSKNMTMLPLPVNTSGPDSYEAAMDVLEKANNEEALSTNHNQEIISQAISAALAPTQEIQSQEDSSREQSLLALLYFTSNDYVKAKINAYAAYSLAINANIKATLPAFIYATSMMYDTKPDFNSATKFFNYAVTNEQENPIIPLLFSIYLDRMMYRFNDGYLTSTALDKIYALSKPLHYDERKAIIQMGIISRYFIVIKLQQQKILSLSQSNKTIKDSPKTLESVKNSLREYKSLLNTLKTMMDVQSSHLDSRLKRTPKFFDKITGNDIKEWETQWIGKISEMRSLWLSYSNGVIALESLVIELERYQAELERARLEKERLESALHQDSLKNNIKWGWWTYLSIIAIFSIICGYLFRRRTSKMLNIRS